MMVLVVCPGCFGRFRVPSRKCGQRVLCPRCRTGLFVPDDEPLLEEDPPQVVLPARRRWLAWLLLAVISIAIISKIGGHCPAPSALPAAPVVRPETRINRTNYSRIQDGWPLSDVIAVLGPGKEMAQVGSVSVWTWQYQNFADFRVISISFEYGKVVSKSMLD